MLLSSADEKRPEILKMYEKFQKYLDSLHHVKCIQISTNMPSIGSGILVKKLIAFAKKPSQYVEN